MGSRSWLWIAVGLLAIIVTGCTSSQGRNSCCGPTATTSCCSVECTAPVSVAPNSCSSCASNQHTYSVQQSQPAQYSYPTYDQQPVPVQASPSPVTNAAPSMAEPPKMDMPQSPEPAGGSDAFDELPPNILPENLKSI